MCLEYNQVNLKKFKFLFSSNCNLFSSFTSSFILLKLAKKRMLTIATLLATVFILGMMVNGDDVNNDMPGNCGKDVNEQIVVKHVIFIAPLHSPDSLHVAPPDREEEEEIDIGNLLGVVQAHNQALSQADPVIGNRLQERNVANIYISKYMSSGLPCVAFTCG